MEGYIVSFEASWSLFLTLCGIMQRALAMNIEKFISLPRPVIDVLGDPGPFFASWPLFSLSKMGILLIFVCV